MSSEPMYKSLYYILIITTIKKRERMPELRDPPVRKWSLTMHRP